MSANRRSFRAQLLLIIVGLLVLVQGATFLVVTSSVRRTTLEQIEANLVLGVNNLDRQIAERMSELADKARLMAGDDALRQTLRQTDDAATLRSALESLQQRLGGDGARVRAARMVWLDADGKFVVETGTRMSEGERESFHILAQRAAADERASPSAGGNAMIDGGLHGLVVVPVFAPHPEIVAWIGVAFPIDGALAAEFKTVSRLELSFMLREPAPRLLASTLASAQSAALASAPAIARLPAVLAPAGDVVVEVPLDGETFITLFRPLALVQGAAVLAAFQRSLDIELAPLRWLERLLFGTAATGLALAALLGIRLARSVSKPVQRLAEHTRVIASGDYAARIAVSGAEEFGRLASAFNSMSDGLAERDRVRDLLDKNVSPEVATQLMRDGAALGGEEREVTILFADIRGFTPMSERLPPRELVAILNRYLERMSAAIEAEGGVIDKFIGDAIMALFGAPVEQSDAADRALRAALRMREALTALNAELLAEQRTTLAIGVGVNTARVVAGNIGSERRRNYSVVGDGVNIASRLQSLTRQTEYATDILVSDATLRSVRGAFVTRALGAAAVKGRAEAVQIYALDR